MDDKTRNKDRKKQTLELRLKEVVMSYAHQSPEAKRQKEDMFANG